MGPIQSSLNHLMGTAWGAAATTAVAAKKFLPSKKQEEQTPKSNIGDPKVETTSSMGNIVKIGKNPGMTHFNSYLAAAKALETGNDTIQQKAVSKDKPIENRLSEIKESIRQKMNDNLNNYALNEFGETKDFSKGIYMLPDGRMVDGTYKGATNFRSVEHNDINSAYEANNYDLKEAKSGTDYMLDYMKRGNIRMLPETKSIDILSKPTSEQLNLIYKMFNEGKLESINITKEDSKTGETKEFLKDIKNEEQIANLIRRNFIGGKK